MFYSWPVELYKAWHLLDCVLPYCGVCVTVKHKQQNRPKGILQGGYHLQDMMVYTYFLCHLNGSGIFDVFSWNHDENLCPASCSCWCHITLTLTFLHQEGSDSLNFPSYSGSPRWTASCCYYNRQVNECTRWSIRDNGVTFTFRRRELPGRHPGMARFCCCCLLLTSVTLMCRRLAPPCVCMCVCVRDRGWSPACLSALFCRLVLLPCFALLSVVWGLIFGCALVVLVLH